MKFNFLRIRIVLVVIVLLQLFVTVMKADNTVYILEIVNHADKNIQLEPGLTLNFDTNGLHYKCNGKQIDLGIDSITKFIYKKHMPINHVYTATVPCKMQLKGGCLYVYPNYDGLFTLIDEKGTVLISRRFMETFVLNLCDYAQGTYIATFNNQSYKLIVK